ncbi:hypothetical protein FRX31_015267, partial [Thalictrum thalictroides]
EKLQHQHHRYWRMSEIITTLLRCQIAAVERNQEYHGAFNKQVDLDSSWGCSRNLTLQLSC